MVDIQYNKIFKPVIIWDPLDVDFTNAQGAGLSHIYYRHLGGVLAGEPAVFTITSRDSYNYPYFMGGAVFQLRFVENTWHERAIGNLPESDFAYRSNVALPLGTPFPPDSDWSIVDQVNGFYEATSSSIRVLHHILQLHPCRVSGCTTSRRVSGCTSHPPPVSCERMYMKSPTRVV